VTVVSVQSFGIAAPSGGSRILRALFEGQHVINVCTSVSPPPAAGSFTELWLPARPGFGRMERTRAGGPLGTLESALARRLEGQIAAACSEHGATAVHAVAHSSDFWPALRAARRLGLPFMLTVHDDLRYLLRTRPDRGLAQRRLAEAWREAAHRFVIGTTVGEEYCARYARRPYTVVTAGLRDEQLAARPASAAGLRAYFAGLFHRAYIPNVPAFAEGLSSLGRSTFTLRCGTVPVDLDATVLPFASEDVVDADLREADLVVTYLGSGRPIVYHGPREGTAYDVLAEHDAAIVVDTLEPAEIAEALEAGLQRSEEIAAKALALARAHFRLEDQRARFWSAFPREAGLAA
jgi:hypothetical protein